MLVQKKIQRIKKFSDFDEKNKDKRIIINYGGAGSGKSHSRIQKFVLRFIQERDIRILVTRKTLPALRITAYQGIIDCLNTLEIPYNINKSEMTIRFKDNIMYFKGLDESEKIKSAEFNYIFSEESTEITKEDLLQLNLRMRRANKNGTNQMDLCFNPIDANHYLIKEYINVNRDDVAVNHSTYKDNPFLPEEYIKELENLVNQDENYYRIYALGEPGILSNIIYSNYIIEDFNIDFECYGEDYGFNNPTAIIGIQMKDGEIYCKEILYQKGLTTEDLISWKDKNKINKTLPCYGDSAEPKTIEQMKRERYNMRAPDKSVKAGIDFLKSKRIHIHIDSVNLQQEIRGYKYRELKDGTVLDEPVGIFDHLMDAMRYAAFTHYYNKKSNTNSILGKIPLSFGGIK